MALTPYIAVADARAAIAWYVEVFGATVEGEPIVMADDRVGHAELTIDGSRLYLSDAYPEIGVTVPGVGADVTLHLDVPDVDGLYQAAVAAGASGEREPEDTPHGRIAAIRSPDGHRWMLNQS
jgi:uncharacterized glyoxalase superfamily protein PhnB